MAPLHTTLRSKLEKGVIAARDVAEEAARAALAVLAVEKPESFDAMRSEQKELRKALRAEAKRLGDGVREHGFPLLIEEIAYQQWHRMLFARFLAENNLLLHPSGIPLSLELCRELAAEEGSDDAWEVAARFAAGMLPGLFPPDNPTVRIRFAPEGQLKLERILTDLPEEVFTSDDGLGWVYQFWQKKKKDEVYASERKIGGADLSPVTQLFTEHYMVRFLLENSLGAWWAARHPHSPLLTEWDYLRFRDDGTPAAGRFETWPETIAEVTVLDPCCGSGHFLVAAFDMLTKMRMEEEGTDRAEAANRVLRDNLFGLELDSRCTQIATFAVALAAWQAGGSPETYLPQIACSGIPVRGQLDDWRKLAHGDARLQFSLEQLHALFLDAPTLGSLIDPRQTIRKDDLFSVSWEKLDTALTQILARESQDDSAAALFGRSAADAAHAASLLGRTYTLVATNVPFLSRGSHTDALRQHGNRLLDSSKNDLATMFMQRSVAFTKGGGSVAVVTPYNWCFLGAYKQFRRELLAATSVGFIANLGPKSFQTPMWDFNIGLTILTGTAPGREHSFAGIDASSGRNAAAKDETLRIADLMIVSQQAQHGNPDQRISLEKLSRGPLLQAFATGHIGLQAGDLGRFVRDFWELPKVADGWVFLQSTVPTPRLYSGRERLLLWEEGKGSMAKYRSALNESRNNKRGWKHGIAVWGKQGVAISQMGKLAATLYSGDSFDNNTAVIIPKDPKHLPAIWTYCSSPMFSEDVRRIDSKSWVTNATLVKVPFDLEHWQKVAEEQYPDGLPEPHSDDPTQWLFKGTFPGAEQPLQVAVARLLGYRWPDQVDDAVTPLADADGIVPLPSVRGELPAAERLRRLLETAYGDAWSPALLDRLLAEAGFAGKTLAEWLDARPGFFQQHVKLFQNRPFIWQIHDGERGGFSVLINYHALTPEKLDRLIHSYLREWIEQQRTLAAQGQTGADRRLAAAEQLRDKLLLIQEGEPPYDIYVRWKPLDRQPIGWEPDLNDGVRLNIRPFINAGILRAPVNVKWGKDRGANPPGSDAQRWAEAAQRAAVNSKELSSTNGSERLNELHLTNAVKRAAR